MDELKKLTNLIYGEGASADYDTRVMMGSSALNRLEANRVKEFGSTLDEVGQKGYYAISNPNVPYKQALSQKFPDEKSETAYKESMAIASGLLRGKIERAPGMFYFTKKEVAKLKKTPKKFNFKAVKRVGDVGDYQVYTY